jgi:hypothetical protein
MGPIDGDPSADDDQAITDTKNDLGHGLLGFIFIPMPILALFGLSAGDEVWVRVVGMLASIIGFYYVQAVRAGLDQFIAWTVPGRYFAAAFMAILVAFNIVGPGLLLFGSVDAADATWT